MDTLDGLKTAIAVVECGSFTSAAERLGISKALVSKYIGELERQQQVRLFNRSTRRLALTEAGQYFYQKALALVDGFEDLEQGLNDYQAKPRGLLRVSLQVTFAESQLAPLLPEFMAQYPDIQLELCLSDRMVDLLEEGIDLAVRIGRIDDSQFIARNICQYPLVLCASPAYLQQYGEPKTPQQLSAKQGLHQCIIDSNFRIGRQWPFSQGNSKNQIEVAQRVAVNSPRAVKELVLSGAGIGLIPQFVIAEELQQGRLVPLLEQYDKGAFDMVALYPHRQFLSRKVQCFIDFLLQNFSNQ